MKTKSIIVSLIFTILIGLLVQFIFTDYQHFVPDLFFFSIGFLTSFLIIFALTPVIMTIAKKRNVLDHPDSRKIHKEPVPLLGGVAIWAAFMITLMFYRPWPDEIRSIAIGGSLIFILGTIDDITPLSSAVRLFGQLAASAIVMSSGLIISFLPNTAWGYAVGTVITIIWILGIVNALNFADGMDGLATGMTMIAAVFFFMIALHLHQLDVSLVAVVLAGCSAGFLFFNFKPAKIYLGDGGSTFLGFLLACLALYGGWSDKGFFVALGIPGLILSLLIFDMCYITVSRIKNGSVRTFKQWLDYTGKDHFHHRLVHLGFREAHAVLFIYVVCTTLGFSALVLESMQKLFPVVILFIQAVFIFMNITILMLAGRKLTETKENLTKMLQSDENFQQKLEDVFSRENIEMLMREEQLLQEKKGAGA